MKETYEQMAIEGFYTPMERVLIEGVQKLTTKEVCDAALETKAKEADALRLDLMLLELEAKADMMDGYKMEEWVL